MRMFRQKERIGKAIAKAGTVAALSRAIGSSEKSIRRWMAGGEMTLSSRVKVEAYLNG